MSPKQGLRHEYAISPIEDFTEGNFQEVLDDPNTSKSAATKKKVKKVVLCTGKVYLEMRKKQETEKRFDVALVRLEQLYPYPKKQVDSILSNYKGAKVAWVQEEPENMGAYRYLLATDELYRSTEVVSRKASASPASGFKSVSDKEQATVIEGAFKI